MLLFGCLGVESPTCRRLNYLNEIEVGGEVKKGNKIQRSPPTRKFPALFSENQLWPRRDIIRDLAVSSSNQ
jgi:hypothetical protein